MTKDSKSDNYDIRVNELERSLWATVLPSCFIVKNHDDYVGNSFVANGQLWTATHVANEVLDRDIQFIASGRRDVSVAEYGERSDGLQIAQQVLEGENLFVCTKISRTENKIRVVKSSIVNSEVVNVGLLKGVEFDPGDSGSIVVNMRLEAVGVLTDSFGWGREARFTPLCETIWS